MMFEINFTGEDQDFLCIVPEELDSVCRLCLRKNGTVNLFDNKDKKHMGGKFNELLLSLSLLQVDESDNLPKKICTICATLINELYFFKEQINASQVILHLALGKLNVQHNQITDVLIRKKNKNNDGMASQDVIFLEKMEICNEINNISDNELNDIENTDYINDYVQVRPCNIPENSIDILEEETEYVCTFCGERFSERQDFLTHRSKEYKKRKQNSRIPCKICKKLIVKGRINDHLNTHTKSRPHICDICGKGFGSLPNLYSHKVTHRKVKPHICEICGKDFVQASVLVDHIRGHKKEESFICDICGYTAFTKIAFGHHKRMHEKEKKNPNVLNRDVNSIRRRRHFYSKVKQCEICQRDFKTHQGLEIHMYTHNGEKPFECSECGKCFRQLAHRRSHMRLHTGEKPHSCPYCGKCFALNGNLQQHIKTHTGERPHKCDICEKSFYTSSSLRKHTKIHVKK